MKRSLGSDRPRYANGRPKPTSRTVATSSGVNREFHKIGIRYGPKQRGSSARPMRDLKQSSFAEMSTWNERKCERWLQTNGLLGKKTGHCCWICKAKMVGTGQHDVLRCSNPQCPGDRPRALAFSSARRCLAFNDVEPTFSLFFFLLCST